MLNLTEARIREIYEDFASARLDRLAEAFHPDVDFLSHAPVEFFPYLGHQRGRTATLSALEQTHQALQITSFFPLAVLINGDDAALTVFVDAKLRSTEKSANFLAAHFLRFRASQIIQFCSIIDSLDAVRQLTGRAASVP